MALFQKQADIKALKQYSQEQQALPVDQRATTPTSWRSAAAPVTGPGVYEYASPEHRKAEKRAEMQMAQQEIEAIGDPQEPGDIDQRNRRARNQALVQRARSEPNKKTQNHKKTQKQAAGWDALSNIDTSPRELIVKPPTQ